jgi:hypothetical protein
VETIIYIKETINLPKFDDLVSYMWEKGISLSYVRTGDDFYDSNIVELAWNKWVDNPEWDDFTNEYIDFEIKQIKKK